MSHFFDNSFRFILSNSDGEKEITLPFSTLFKDASSFLKYAFTLLSFAKSEGFTVNEISMSSSFLKRDLRL